MNLAPRSKSVRKIVLLERDASGGVTPVTLFKRKGKKKGSRALKPVEKAVRKLTSAISMGTGTYRTRHGKSNSKKRNGWLKDIRKNVSKADKKARKEL